MKRLLILFLTLVAGSVFAQYPTTIDQNSTAGQTLRAPLATEAPGNNTVPPVGVANPTLPNFLSNLSTSLIGVENTLGLPSSPASGSILYKLNNLPTGGFVVSPYYSTAGSLPAVNGTTVANGNTALVGTTYLLYQVQSGAWVNTGISLYSPPGAAQSITHFICIGDSYTDNGNSAFFTSGWNFQTSGESFISNGPSWFSLLSKVYGFPAVPRWNTGGAVGNNYSIASADIDTSPVFSGTAYDMQYQVSTYLSDVSNNVPSGTLIAVWMGINTTRNAYGSYIGAHDSTDPLGTLNAAFTMPAAGATVTVPQAGGLAEANIAVNDQVWITTAGYLQVTAISGGNITLKNVNAAGNATSGTNIPSGSSVRWGAFAFLDAEMVKYVTQINALVSAGATKILVLNIPNFAYNTAQGGGAGSSEFTSVANIINYWNSSLATQMASISAVKIFDAKTLWQNMATTPNAYGLTVVDLGESSDAFNSVTGFEPDRYLYYDNLHPSAAAHRVIANAVIPTINGMFPSSQQTALALQTFGTDQANTTIPGPGSFTPTGSTLAANVNPFPTELNSTDGRMDYLSRLVDNPFLKTEMFWDFTESLSGAANSISGCPYNEVGVHPSDANLGYWGNPTQYNLNGARWLNTIALNDFASEIFTSPGFLSPQASSANGGPIVLQWRLTNVVASGDTIVITFGLEDSASTATSTQNGIFIQITEANGTVTSDTFNIEKAGVITYTASLGALSLPSAGNAQTFTIRSDFSWQRFYVYEGNTLVLTTPTLTGTSVIPTTPIFAAHSVLKTVLGTGGNQSYLLVDGFHVLQKSYRRQ